MNKISLEEEVPEEKLIFSRTDPKGNITYVNDTFSHLSGYEPAELIGKPHNVVRHPDMPHSIFKHMWEMLQDGKSWRGYIKNMRKDGGFYWVDAKVDPLYEHGQLIGYKSMRSYVPPEKRHEMEHKYAAIALAEEDVYELTIRLKKETWNKLRDYAKLKEMTSKEAIIMLIDDKLSAL